MTGPKVTLYRGDNLRHLIKMFETREILIDTVLASISMLVSSTYIRGKALLELENLMVDGVESLFSPSLFQALGQCRRIGKKRGTSDERGPARRSSRASFRSVPTDREPGTGYFSPKKIGYKYYTIYRLLSISAVTATVRSPRQGRKCTIKLFKAGMTVG